MYLAQLQWAARMLLALYLLVVSDTLACPELRNGLWTPFRLPIFDDDPSKACLETGNKEYMT
jgi:hypothetical protein